MKAAVALLACAALTAPLSAQVAFAPTSPQFDRIARQAQEGFGDSARTAIARILARTPTTDATYPEALYTSGFVARTGDSMRSVFSRLALDFSTSPWADKALVRWAQLEYGFNNMEKVVTEITHLVEDYPNSPALAVGTLWGARAAFSLQKMQLGCGWLTKGIAAAGDDLETKNQLQFAKQSCAAGNGVQIAPATPDSLRQGPPPRTGDTTTKRPLPAPPPPPPPAATTKPAAGTSASPWRVQVAALTDKNVIKRLSQKLEAAGFKAYTVAGPNGLTKVQAGPFATRAAALAAVPKVKAAAGGSPIVVAAP